MEVQFEQRVGLLAGAIIGDFPRGRINREWPRELVAGITLHRRIDAVQQANSLGQLAVFIQRNLGAS